MTTPLRSAGAASWPSGRPGARRRAVPTRRYHGLLVVATEPPMGRRLALASLDPVLVLGERRVPLATHEWAAGALSPAGHVHLETFTWDGVPCWRWSIGPVVLDVEVAMAHGRPAVGVTHRLVA